MKKILHRPSIPWVLGLFAIGCVIAWFISSSINSAKHLTTVWVASNTISVDTIIQDKDLIRKDIPSDVIPDGAIEDPKAIIGKYTDTTIYKDQPIVKLAVSDAQTMREIVRRYGMDYDGVTVQLDQSDLSTDHVQPGDNVDVLGVFGNGKEITSSFIAIDVPVIAVDTKDRKLLIAAKRADAPEIAKDLAAGKIRVFLDPRPFGAVDTMPVPSQVTVPILNPKDKSSSVVPEPSKSQIPTSIPAASKTPQPPKQ